MKADCLMMLKSGYFVYGQHILNIMSATNNSICFSYLLDESFDERHVRFMENVLDMKKHGLR